MVSGALLLVTPGFNWLEIRPSPWNQFAAMPLPGASPLLLILMSGDIGVRLFAGHNAKYVLHWIPQLQRPALDQCQLLETLLTSVTFPLFLAIPGQG